MSACDQHLGCDAPYPSGGAARLALAETTALLSLAAFLGYAWLTGRVQAFLAPAYAWLPPAAAGLLACMALARLRSLKKPSACGCGSSSSGPVQWCLAVALMVPIAMGLAIDPRQFSADGVKRRAASAVLDPQLQRAMAWVLGQAGSAVAHAPADLTLPPDPTVLDLVRGAAVGQAAAWDGLFVTVIGQCDVSGEPGDRRFGLYRFVVTCCIADAQLVSVDVLPPPDVSLEPRQWLRVGGVLRLEHSEAGGEPVIHAASISKIPPPVSPYL